MSRTKRILAHLFKWLYTLYSKTWRLSIQGLEETKKLLQEQNKGVVFILWHDSLIISPILEKLTHIQPVHYLISKSRDGDIAAHFAQLFSGFFVLRVGHRERAQALKKSVKLIAQNHSLAITPDGPRGPRRKIKLGALFAAQKMQTHLIPIVYTASRSVHLPSWDRFQLPLPFAKITIQFMEPIPTHDPEEIEKKMAYMEEKLALS